MSNVPDAHNADILSCLDFQLGSFPAKFLGVPLITTKLSLADCYPLLEKIKSRIGSWTNRFLSYAGRLQLIKSVIFAIQSYWSAYFILPAAALKDIQSTLSRFLWKGPSLQRFGAKVAWSKITKPITEGGLAIKHLDDWNRALMLLQLWNIVNPLSKSLWASWAKIYLLKDKYFWTTSIPAVCSWAWRKVLILRPLAMQHINYKIGNGVSTNLWFDPWLNHKPLASSLQSPIIFHSRLGSAAMVSNILCNGAWCLPISSHPSVSDFRHSFDFSRPNNNDMQDLVLWDSYKDKEVKASVLWNSIRQRGNLTVWDKLVWNKFIPPRYSFLLWLAFHNALKTMDRLSSYGLTVNPICSLCNIHMENFNHLFFHCPFSFRILHSVMRFCGWRGLNRDWSCITDFIINRSENKIHHNIFQLGFATVVYHIWTERNARIHANISLPARTIVQNIMHLVKCKLHTIFKFQKAKNNFSMLVL